MLKNFFDKYRDAGILFIRIGLGFAFIFVHGWAKISGGPALWEKIGGAMGNYGLSFAPVFWGFMASASEFAGGILLLLGLCTRPAAAFMAFTMLTAFMMHSHNMDPWSKAIYPMEMFSVFMGLLFIGAGKYRIDALISNRKKNSGKQ